MHNTQHTTHNTQHTTHNTQHTTRSIDYTATHVCHSATLGCACIVTGFVQLVRGTLPARRRAAPHGFAGTTLDLFKRALAQQPWTFFSDHHGVSPWTVRLNARAMSNAQCCTWTPPHLTRPRTIPLTCRPPVPRRPPHTADPPCPPPPAPHQGEPVLGAGVRGAQCLLRLRRHRLGRARQI